MDEKKFDGWLPDEIKSLPADYWESKERRENLLHRILSVAIACTCHDLSTPLPIENWRKDLNSYQIKGEEIEIFWDILAGKYLPNTDDFLQIAASCLYRLRQNDLSPKDLFPIHFRLLNFLTEGDWGHFSGDVFANLVSQQWQHIAQKQKFSLLAPSLYAPMLMEQCNHIELKGYSKAASILEVAATATGVNLNKSCIEFLYRIKNRQQN